MCLLKPAAYAGFDFVRHANNTADTALHEDSKLIRSIRPRLDRNRLTFLNRTDVGKYVLVFRVSRWIRQGPFTCSTVKGLCFQAQYDGAIILHRGDTNKILFLL